MLLKSFSCSEGIFRPEFRRQLLVSLSVTMLSFSHGIGLGWLAPMLPKLQSYDNSPLQFFINVEEASWVGAFISIGGLSGNFLYAFIMSRFGRKIALVLLAVPHMTVWVLFYFAQSVEWLFLARFCGGLTGGGLYIVLPIFIGEIADNSIRGRLCSIFTLTINAGILTGFVLASHLSYHLIPYAVIGLPLSYLLSVFFFPESPQQLLRWNRTDEAEQAFQFYCKYSKEKATKEEALKCNNNFKELQQAITLEQSNVNGNVGVGVRDFCNKRAIKALLTGFVLMTVSIFCGTFALINYMSNVFAEVKTEMDPNTNTIIIGAVQVTGTIIAIFLVDRYGRRILLIISSAGTSLGTAAFGVYALFAEINSLDLSAFSSWLPLLLVAFTIFLANIGIIPISLVVLVEILPAKIRALSTSICLALLSCFAFISLKTFPVLMDSFGLSATMWLCSSISTFGLFYITIFVEETKGKSLQE